MTSDINLQDRVVVVTGASRGIGQAIAEAAARAGAAVVLAARKAEPLEAAAASIRESGGRALAAACHTGHADEVASLLDRAVAAFGKVDAWSTTPPPTPISGPPGSADAAFDKIFEVNVKGYLYACREFAARAAGAPSSTSPPTPASMRHR